MQRNTEKKVKKISIMTSKKTKDKKDTRLPTATAHQSRLRFFQPTRRPKAIEKTIKSAWGVVKIKGRLGQAHADIFEAILSNAESYAEMTGGRIKLLVDPYKITKISHQASWSTFQKNLDDLMQALIEIKEPVKLAGIGHLIDHIDKAQRRDGSYVTKKNPLTGGQREMWRIEIGKAGAILLEKDLKLFYQTDKIAAMRHGISQAVARLVLTHRAEPSGGWKLDRLLSQVCGELSSIQFRHRRHEVRMDTQSLAKIGIEVDAEGDRITKACSKSAVRA